MPADPTKRSPEQQATWILAQLLDFHWREDKPVWWDLFRLEDLTEEEALDERSTLAGLGFIENLGVVHKIPTDRYSFPDQETELDVGDVVHFAGDQGREKFGTIVGINLRARTVDVHKTKATAYVHPRIVFEYTYINPKELAASLSRLGQWVAEHGIDAQGAFRAARDLLLQRVPRLRTSNPNPLKDAAEQTVAAACRIVDELEDGVLAIQGPPGTGKTFTGANLIVSLVSRGRPVGVTAGSHKVIQHLLGEVVALAANAHVPLTCGHKWDEGRGDGAIRLFDSNAAAEEALKMGSVHVLGGTPWFWAREQAKGLVDVLVVDEAGQLSLANALAVAQGAGSLVLIGDPRQLEQPLTEAVQRILDRIVFVRVCEARGVARGEPLRRAWELWRERGGALYAFLVQTFRDMEPLFNGGLFAPHVSEKLHIEKDDVLDRVLDALYGDTPYSFELMPVEILGSIYERFLGSTIHLTAAGHARIDEKIEVRHAGGVYYTPSFVVDAIVDKTLGPLTKNCVPRELLKLRIIDPACGSGSFIIAAYQFLMDAHLSHYQNAGIGRTDKGEAFEHDGELRLTLKRKKEILSSCLFGVDKDSQAVEVAQMSLYLKLMEGESEQSLALRETIEMFRSEKYLPSLAGNIICGNSLVSSQDLEPQLSLRDDGSLAKINPFDWRSSSTGFGDILEAGGFDAVIGNPPYVRIQEMQKWAPDEVKLFKSRFQAAASGNFDIYVLFVEQALSLLNKAGRIGFILPHKFFQAQYGAELRRMLVQSGAVREVVDFGDAQVFEGATTYTCLLFLGRKPNKEILYRKVRRGEEGDLPSALDEALNIPAESVPLSQLSRPTWNFRGGGSALAERLIKDGAVPLGDIAHLFVGVQTDADDVFILEVVRASTSRLTVRSKAEPKPFDIEPDLARPFLKGSLDIKRYEPPHCGKRLLFPYRLGTPKVPLIDGAELAKTLPDTWAYLERHEARLRKGGRGKLGPKGWHGYVYRKNHGAFGEPKLLIPAIGVRAQVSIDETGEFFFVGSGGGGGGAYGIRPLQPMNLWFLLAVLNSALAEGLLRSLGVDQFRGGYHAYNKQHIEQLPIRLLETTLPGPRSDHDAIVALAERMLQLLGRHAESASEREAEAYVRQLQATDEEIDDRVFELYGVSGEERRLVEQEVEGGSSVRILGDGQS